jgi:hypothetical protein
MTILPKGHNFKEWFETSLRDSDGNPLKLNANQRLLIAEMDKEPLRRSFQSWRERACESILLANPAFREAAIRDKRNFDDYHRDYMKAWQIRLEAEAQEKFWTMISSILVIVPPPRRARQSTDDPPLRETPRPPRSPFLLPFFNFVQFEAPVCAHLEARKPLRLHLAVDCGLVAA